MSTNMPIYLNNKTPPLLVLPPSPPPPGHSTHSPLAAITERNELETYTTAALNFFSLYFANLSIPPPPPIPHSSFLMVIIAQ